MKTISTHTLLAFTLLGTSVLTQTPAIRAASIELFQTDFPLADHSFTDLTGNGEHLLILAGDQGQITTWPTQFNPQGSLRIPHPDRSILCPVPPTEYNPAGALAALSPDGLALYPFNPQTGLAPNSTPVLTEGTLQLRLGRPRFAAILQDINGDHRPDLLLPNQKTYGLWLQQETNSSQPHFAKTAEVRTDVRIVRETDANQLSDRLENSFHIPSLHFEDINGDGRADLLASTGQRRSFHVQTATGQIPPDPTVVLDLDIFRDTTPRSDIRPGRTLAGSDDATLAMQDLDGDTIPDYVVAHRRKLWVFHGSAAGPQFTNPSAIMKTAEDVTVALITPLDDNDLPDLLLLRVQIPSVGMILKGLFSNIDIEISATGYANQQGASFAPSPQWRGGVVLRLPELMKIIRDPQSLIGRLQEAANQFRDSTSSDFNGDGTPDLALLNTAGDQLEIWFAKTNGSSSLGQSPLRQILFEDTDRVWSIDRILAAIGELAQSSLSAMTGGREPDLTLSIDRGESEETIALLSGNTPRAQGREIILLTRDPNAGGNAIVRAIHTGE